MAAMHRSSVQDQIADVTECSICAEIFTNPKVLPCVHTFCLHCLETYGKEKKPLDEMVCPICRKEFLIPNGGFSHLPSNFFIGKMVEIGKLAMAPKTKSLCALCPEDDEVLAQMFCVDCEQTLCGRCANGHKKSRFSQNHQVIELGSETKCQELNLRNSYCDNHSGELIKMFCYEENVAICLVCCVESHQSHRCVNVTKAAGEFGEQLKRSLSKVAQRLPECQEFGDKLDKYKKEFQDEVYKTEESIRREADQMIKLINLHASLLIQNLKLVREKNCKAFEMTKQDIERFRVMIESYSRYSEELLARGSPVDICRAANQMLTRAEELETLSANCSGDCFCCDTLTFHPSHIEKIMTANGLNNAVGELTVSRSSDWLLKFDKETQATDDMVSDESVLVCKGERIPVTRRADSNLYLPNETKSQSAFSNRAIFVWQISRKLNFARLEMIFENKRYGGGIIEKIDYRQEEGTATITFEDPNVAASFLKKEMIEYGGQQMFIRKPEDQAANAGLEEASAKQLPSLKHTVSDSFDTVKVSGLPQDMSDAEIFIYFGSKKRSGGGGILKVLEHQKEKGKAVIKFNNSADAIEVCRRSHIFLGATVKISALETTLDDVKSCAIEVKGLPNIIGLTEHILTLFFENSIRSGGGPVEKVFLNKTARSAIIVFTDAMAVVGVMKKKPITLDGAILEVNILEPASPPRLILKDVDTKRLFAKRLPSFVTRESLWEYLGPAAKAKLVGWTQCAKISNAFLEFNSEPDYLSIRRLVCSKPFLGKMISIRRVPITSSILITGIPSSISADFVAMYFENPRNGGTGDDCKVKMLPDKVSAIVEFERPDYIHEITSRQHSFNRKKVKVEPYYP